LKTNVKKALRGFESTLGQMHHDPEVMVPTKAVTDILD
jgi:hypothetical protein